jgi:hypothetical protein
MLHALAKWMPFPQTERARCCALLFGLLTGCGGGDGPTPVAPLTPVIPVIPAAATALQTKLVADMGRSMARIASLEAGTVFVLVPGMPLAPNMVSSADTSAGSPPNTWTFKGSFDGNGNGQDETTLDGRLTFANDPTQFTTGFNGAQGSVTVGIDILGLMHVYRGDLAYSIGMTEHRLSGRGTFTDPLTGTTTTMTIDAADPLTIKLADGSAGAKPNACAHSFNGPAQVSIAASGGTLSSQWRFAYDSSMVTVSGASFTDTSGRTTALPDAQVDLGCSSTASSINDWNGRFRIQWACLPLEFGEFNTTITVKNATTVSMIDDGDMPADAYEASLIGTSPRAIRGFFIDGPAGTRYREDFNWTLNLDGSGFSQSSRYVYFEGANTGVGGVCAARATRI